MPVISKNSVCFYLTQLAQSTYRKDEKRSTLSVSQGNMYEFRDRGANFDCMFSPFSNVLYIKLECIYKDTLWLFWIGSAGTSWKIRSIMPTYKCQKPGVQDTE